MQMRKKFGLLEGSVFEMPKKLAHQEMCPKMLKKIGTLGDVPARIAEKKRIMRCSFQNYRKRYVGSSGDEPSRIAEKRVFAATSSTLP